MVHTNADGRTLFSRSERNCSKSWDSSLSDGSELWLAQNLPFWAGRESPKLDREISPQLHLWREQTHHSALQWEGDNILQRRPDLGKKVLVHSNVDGLGGRFFKIVSKTNVGAESVTRCKMVTIPSSRAPDLRSFATPTQQCPARARAEEGGKNRHRSPALPRHSTSLHRGFSSSRQFHSTSASSKNGESRANSLVARCGVGVGGSTPPRSNSGGSGYFSTNIVAIVWENTREGGKILSVQKTAPIFSGGRGMRSGGVRKFLPQPRALISVSREHFVGSIFWGLKMLSWALDAAGRSSRGLWALG